MKHLVVISLFMWLLVAPLCAANDFEQASQKLCGKIQQCAYEELESQELTPQMREMINGVVDSMCKEYLQQTENLQAGEAEQSAVACLNSLSELDCSELQGQQPSTSACDKYEKLAEQYQQ